MTGTMYMIWVAWAESPVGRSTIERELDDFLLSLGLNPGPSGY